MDELELLDYAVEYCTHCGKELTLEEEELNVDDNGDMYCDDCYTVKLFRITHFTY